MNERLVTAVHGQRTHGPDHDFELGLAERLRRELDVRDDGRMPAPAAMCALDASAQGSGADRALPA